jgi:hypothetical protein
MLSGSDVCSCVHVRTREALGTKFSECLPQANCFEVAF